MGAVKFMLGVTYSHLLLRGELYGNMFTDNFSTGVLNGREETPKNGHTVKIIQHRHGYLKALKYIASSHSSLMK